MYVVYEKLWSHTFSREMFKFCKSTQRLDTVWYFSFSITQSVWKLSLTQEGYLCSCYWIMNFKQISNTFLLKQQTVHFQFPKSWRYVPPSAGPVSSLLDPVCPVGSVRDTQQPITYSHSHNIFILIKISFKTYLMWKWTTMVVWVLQRPRRWGVLSAAASRGQLCTGLHQQHSQIKKWSQMICYYHTDLWFHPIC